MLHLESGINTRRGGWDLQQFAMAFLCEQCGRSYRHKASYRRHICKIKKKLKDKQRFECNYCQKVFTRNYTLKQHVIAAHSGRDIYVCGLCTDTFETRAAVEAHRLSEHTDAADFTLIQEAHDGACELHRLYLPSNFTSNFSACLDFCYDKVGILLDRILLNKRFARIGFNLSLRFTKAVGSSAEQETSTEMVLGREESEVITHNLRPPSATFSYGATDTNIRKMAHMFEDISSRFNDFNYRGSGWVLADCLFFDVSVGQCLSLQGSCSIHPIKSDSKGKVIVIANGDEGTTDHRCFYHALASFFLTWRKKELMFDDNPLCHTHAELERFVRDNVVEAAETPVALGKVHSVEKANAHLDLAINVMYGADDGQIYPAYASPNINAKHTVNLLLFHRAIDSDTGHVLVPKKDEEFWALGDYGDSGSDKFRSICTMQRSMHYAPISDIGKLFAKRFDGCTKPAHFCFNCFMRFQHEDALNSHVTWCHTHEGQIYRVPKEGAQITFEPKRKDFKLGYVFFFDFETLQV